MPTLSRLTVGAAAAAAGTAGVLALPVFGGTPRGDRLARMQASPQWREGRFRNALPTLTSPSARTILDFWTTGRAVRTPTAPVPTVTRTRADFDAPQSLRLTWLGHSTTLVEIEGRRFLTDPVFGPTASPGRAFGVARFFEPPLPLAELPAVDAVVLSHDHYDHLDAGTVRQLAARVPRWVAPLGVGAHLERWGVPAGRITELDWWDETEVGGVRLVCTPSRHFSGRSVTDRDQTLWCGWAFVGDRHRVYSTGDGAFSPDFARVGERLGPFDAALVEIGAYSPAWPDVHMGPEQAVQAHLAARGGLLVPVHWATFNLAFHGWTEPVERLLAASAAAGVRVAVPRPGESVGPADPPGVIRWWPEVAWKTAAEVPIVSSGV